MQKQRSIYSHFWGLEKSTLDTQKTISCWPTKRKIKPVRSTKMGTKIKPSSITPRLLIQVSLKPKFPKKISIMEVTKEAIQPLRSIPPKLPRKTKIRTK